MLNIRNKIACCYFPTTVMLIDDRISFLRNMSLKLDSKLPYKLSDKPQQALEYIKQSQQPNILLNKWLSYLSEVEIEEDWKTHCAVDVNLSVIHQEIYNPRRFDDISVLLIDYSMPNMNGLEFCQELEGMPIKKVLVTGEADHKIAVEAFNKGIIDKFILKDAPDFFVQINDIIAELQRRYFVELSEVVVKNLSSDPACCLSDKVFINCFNNYCHEQQIAEYYLVDSFGSFLMLDFAGQPSWFLIKSEREMATYYDIAKDNEGSAEIVTALATRSQLPFFFTEEDLQQPITSWNKYLHPATKLVGDNNTYYYSILHGAGEYSLQLDKIYSQQQHLANI